MKSLFTYIAITLFLSTFCLKFQWDIAPFDFQSVHSSTSLTCPNTCQISDSLALIALYNSTQGINWNTNWNTSLPVCTPWPGIELDNDGYVVKIILSSNNLTGPLPPEIGNFSRLGEMQLDNNNLSGNIPPEIGNLSEIEICFLDDNNFQDTIPAELGNLPKLNTLYLDNNQLTGAVPISFINLNNLFKFDIFNNMIDSIPDLNMINLQSNRFRIYNNNVTFDDIVLNDLNALGTFYQPQDSVNQAYTANLLTGDNYILDLGFDNGILDNSYQWFKDGLPLGIVTNSNKLNLSPVTWTNAGEYRCRVTNPNAPLLTLHTRPVTITVACGISVFEVNDTLCQGAEVTVNSIVYNESNPSGTQTLSPDQYGCDSMIIVNLTYRAANITELNETICIGDTVFVNGNIYDANNPTGMETLAMPDQYGCDSIIDINLNFYTAAAAGNLSPIICQSDSIELFGIFYDHDNPSGTVLLENATATGCDSTLFIEVQFYQAAIGSFNQSVCEGGSINYEGQVFDEDTPNGQVNLGAVSQNGCDSIVNVSLSFFGPMEGTLEETLCAGDSIVIQNTVFNESNPAGTVFFPNGGQNSCDSIVFVNLSFGSSVVEHLDLTLCNTDAIIVNNITYDISNPNGSEMISGGSNSGCDSLVMVDLSFYPQNIITIDSTLCFGDSIVVQGTTYNANQPSGIEVFTGASLLSCDSTVVIDLSFYPQYLETLNPSLCPGESIIVNGITYDEDNPSGTEILLNSSSTACDSTVIIDLIFNESFMIDFEPLVCSDNSFTINNNLYDINNPSGTESMQSSTGCDSIINISLSFYPNDPGIINDVLCTGQEIVINGITYDEGNPSGTEVLQNETINGCDSTILINLSFVQNTESTLNPSLCPGESIVVNGFSYDENNPNGIQVFENEAANGCDSIVNIDLSFHLEVIENFTATICPSDSILINGIYYSINNPNGTEVFQNASSNGCDSTVLISLDFYNVQETFIDDILCEQDELIINNQVYNISNFSGTEIIENATINGCDSIIIIDLTFNMIVEEVLNTELCTGESLVINSIVYNESHPDGIAIFPNGAVNGCDSIINISLSFMPDPIEHIVETLCVGEFIMVNDIMYDFLNPTGTEIIENGSVNACDSTIIIELSFYPLAEGDLNPIICHGASFEFNGTVFDADTPTGMVVLENMSSHGCDSTVQVQLGFYDLSEHNINSTLCADESMVINGTTYDINHPNGTETLENASFNGCDSTILVALDFLEEVIFETSASICEGSNFEIANNTYNESGLYEINLEQAAANGCDSTVLLNLSVLDAESLGLADLGEDIYQCEDFATLTGNLPTGSNGLWTNLNGDFIDDPQNPSIDLENLQSGTQQFIWTLSTSQCTNYDADTIQITIQSIPDAVDDVFNLDIETSLITLDLFENDDLSRVDGWVFELLSTPSMGDLTALDEGLYEFKRNNPLGGELIFDYQLCNEDCPDLCDIASVRISLEKQDIDQLDIPNAITPNEDGINEYFMFPQIEFEPDRYPDRELIIFNRWGNIIYESKPYQNDWNGVDQSDRPLPQGTYYYVLRLDISSGTILKGDVSILK